MEHDFQTGNIYRIFVRPEQRARKIKMVSCPNFVFAQRPRRTRFYTGNISHTPILPEQRTSDKSRETTIHPISVHTKRHTMRPRPRKKAQKSIKMPQIARKRRFIRTDEASLRFMRFCAGKAAKYRVLRRNREIRLILLRPISCVSPR